MSMIDDLAVMVSAKSGCQVVVHRLVDPDTDRLGRPKVGMYRIEFKRGATTFTFGAMRVAHAKQCLAMLADLLDFGFLEPAKGTKK